MIDTIELINFSGVSNCRFSAYSCTESFPPVDYTFEKGKTYCIISDFGCGSWGLSNCLGGDGSITCGEILVNGATSRLDDLIKYSCFVSSLRVYGMKIKPKKDSIRICIERALKNNRLFCVNDIKRIFCLSDERFERPIAYTGGETWLASLAIGFSLQKDIFCFPWLSERNIEIFKMTKRMGIIDCLKNNNKIVIIPSSQKDTLINCCDASIVISNRRVSFE